IPVVQLRRQRQAEEVEEAQPDYEVTTLKRWALGTPYLDVCNSVARFLAQPELAAAWPVLVADATGVGEAVCENVRARLAEAKTQGGMVQVVITGGNTITQTGEGRLNVSKKQLVSVMQVLMGSRRLKVAPALPDARTLLRELETFQVKISDAGNESFESWRER